MSEQQIAGVQVAVNEEGFLTDHSQWTREVAVEIAKEEGLEELTEGHWKVLDFLQKDYKEKGSMPSIRRVKNAGGIPTKELYQLFPEGPLKKAARIAGLPKPASCV
jgi:tRNA 2-thiouridine synthesizing protein E